jgi:hypothetical protein
MRYAALTMLVGILLLAIPACAQTQARKVVVLGGTAPNPFQAQVVDAVKARIAASTRYVIGEPNAAEIEVSLICFGMSQITKNVTGGVCAMSVNYWPPEFIGLSCGLGQTVLLTGPESSEIGEQFFEAMVNSSTEQELSKHLSAMKASIELYESFKAKNK